MHTEPVTDALGMAILRRKSEKRAEEERTIAHSAHGDQLRTRGAVRTTT
jgi:hypothetical protein